jgi:hypothetical protein
MAVVKLKTGSEAKKEGLRGLVSGNDTPSNAAGILVELFDGNVSVSSTETMKFKGAKQVSGTQNAETETHASVMFAVQSGKTVNKIKFARSGVGGSGPVDIFEINLTGGDIKTFQNAGTYTINSVKITLREDI